MTLLRKGIEEQVSVQENGRRRKTTKRELMITQVINKAASGNLKALQYLMPQIIEADALTQASREQISTSDFDEKVDLLTQAVTLLDKLGVKLPVPKAAVAIRKAEARGIPQETNRRVVPEEYEGNKN